MMGWHGRGKRRRYEFTIRPTKGSSLYVHVMIWDRMDAVKGFARLIGLGARRSRRAAAFCTEAQTFKDIPRGCVAVVCFGKKHVGVGTVSHEMFHAAVAWGVRRRWKFAQLADRKGVIPRTHPEEKMAELVGQLTRGFYNHCYDNGVIAR
jgi:hypothetical protein